MTDTFRIDIYRFGTPIGRFCCRDYEPYSPQDPKCKKAMTSCGHNPGYESIDGIACYPARTENTERLQYFRALWKDGVVYD